MSWVSMLLIGWLMLNVLFVAWRWFCSRPTAVGKQTRPYTNPRRPW